MEEFDPGDDDEEYWKMEDFQNHSKSYGSNGKLSWIWKKGVNLGKKMVLTGVVVSSASVVLPPLVALSAIGVAFSVPAGFVIATYACGEKLLNIMLPMPLEDNGTICCDKEEYRIYLDNVDEGYYETGDLEFEEQEYEEDVKQGLQMRIELVDENNDRDWNDYEQAFVDKDELDKGSSEVSEIVEEVYEEDVGDDVVDEEQAVDSKATHEILEGIIEAENEISSTVMEDNRMTRVSEIVEEGYEEDAGENIADEGQSLDSKAIPELLEMIKEVENDMINMEKEEGRMLRVIELDGEGYEVHVKGYMADEQPVDSNAIRETVEEIIEEENGMERVSEIVEERYEGDVGEYIADEEQPFDSKVIPEMLGGVEGEENETNLMEKEERRILSETETDREGYEENVAEYKEDEEQFLDSRASFEILEGIEKMEMEIETETETDGEGYEEAVGEYVADEEQPLVSRATPEILEGTEKVENEISLLEEEEDEMAKDSSGEFAVADQLDGENKVNVELIAFDMIFVPPRDIEEENEFPGLEEDRLRIETMESIEDTSNEGKYDQKRKAIPIEETAEENEESRIDPVNDMSHDKEQKNLTVPKEVELVTDDRGVMIDLESESNVEQLREDMASVSPRTLDEENEFAGVEEGLIEMVKDEGKTDLKRNDSLAKETLQENEELGIVPVENMLQDKGNENLTIPKEVVPTIGDSGILGELESENDVEQETEDLAFVLATDTKEENGFADVEEEELKRETTGLIEKMRDEGKADEKRENITEKGTPEGDEESGRVFLKGVSQDKENKNLTVIPEGLEPAMDDKESTVDLKNDVFLGNISNEGTGSKSSVENQVKVNLKIDGDHTVTEVHQGAVSDKLGTLIISEEDTTEEAVESVSESSDNGTVALHHIANSFDTLPKGPSEEDTKQDAVESVFDLSDNGTVAPHHISGSSDTLPEGESQSLEKRVAVTVEYHEVAIESIIPVPGLLGDDQSLNKMVEITSDYHEVAIEPTLPMSEHPETMLDQGATAGSPKVNPDVEKVWEQINAMRTIVGYAYTPHHTCAEELKALYDFTGVELPTLSNDPSDLADINEKLHFLMSIIGVK